MSTRQDARSVVAGFRDPNGTVGELIHDPVEKRTAFAVWDGKECSIVDEFQSSGGVNLSPVAPEHPLIAHQVIAFGREPRDYGTVEGLREIVASFVRRYVDLTPDFEAVAVTYVLLSWQYDRFDELPYLRVRGNYGTGKSRFLKVMGSLCFRGSFAGGASSVASIFHILHDFQGTLILDEADFRFSDEKSEIAKILNNGNQRGFPVLRCEPDKQRHFHVRPYQVYGPKILATRREYEDIALESRCLTEMTDGRRVRANIPLRLPDSFDQEAEDLRGQLLMYRFRESVDRLKAAPGHGQNLRVEQITAPLRSVGGPPTDEVLDRVATRHAEALSSRETQAPEDVVAECITELGTASSGPISIKAIQTRYGEKTSDRTVSPRWIGYMVRQRLGFRTAKSNGNYVIPREEWKRAQSLSASDAVEAPEQVDLGTSGI